MQWQKHGSATKMADFFPSPVPLYCAFVWPIQCTTSALDRTGHKAEQPLRPFHHKGALKHQKWHLNFQKLTAYNQNTEYLTNYQIILNKLIQVNFLVPVVGLWFDRLLFSALIRRQLKKEQKLGLFTLSSSYHQRQCSFLFLHVQYLHCL